MNLTPGDLLVQRDGRVWRRDTFGAHLGTLHRSGTQWRPECGCGSVLDPYRTRREALRAFIEHLEGPVPANNEGENK